MIIEFQDVSKSYDKHKVITSLSAVIEPGNLLAIIGVNGAGKTTLLNMLAGVTGMDAGVLKFDDQEFERDNLAQRKKLCYLSDFYHLFPEKTVLENIATHLKLWEVKDAEIEDKIIQWLDDFDLLEHANSQVAFLSRGQTYKAALISLMAVDPELWLLDEPFASGMDPQGISHFRNYARAATERGSTVIYTTQLLDLAEKFSDQIWILDQQQLKLSCNSEEVREHGNLEQLFNKLCDND